ncbi:MAG TPA: hypothetical protein VGR41_06630 [Actinomycetota bacterium]|jgi:hypothetical protein|nr:hypothetical protein [Actinomycetota bacterium]
MKSIKLVATTLAIAAGGGVFVGSGVAGSQTAGGYERVVKVINTGPSDGCGGDTCVGGLMEPVTAMFWSVGDHVRVVASVSLRYRTSVGDRAEVSLLWRPAGAVHFREASPGPSPLMSSRLRTTASISWSIRGLQAGKSYEFAVGVSGLPAGSDGEFEVTTRDLVIVLEAS